MHAAPRISAGLVASVGFVVIVGWLFESRMLVAVSPDLPPMSFNLALGFVLLGSALLLEGTTGAVRLARPAALALAAVVAAIALATLLQYLLEADLGIDAAITRSPWGIEGDTRMAPNSALALLLGALVLLLAPARWSGAAGLREGLSLAILLIATLVALAYVLGSGTLTTIASSNSMAVHSCVLFLLTAVALLSGPARGRIAQVLASDTYAGWLARHTLPVALVLPIAVAWLRLRAQEHGLIDLSTGVVLMTIVTMAGFALVVLYTGARLSRSELELQSANAQLELFMGTAAHELRTPLASIRNFSDLMLERWDDIADADRRTYLALIAEQSRRLLRLVGDLLTVARAQAGRLHVHPVPVDVGEVVAEVKRELGHDAVELAVTAPAFALIDPDHLKQVVVNLLANAFAHGAPPVVASLSSTDRQVRLSVCDSGDGVPPEHVAAIFGRFAQGRARAVPARTETSGSGLGLTIARSIARAYGGDLSYEPGESRGACFVVTLPAAPASAVSG